MSGFHIKTASFAAPALLAHTDDQPAVASGCARKLRRRQQAKRRGRKERETRRIAVERFSSRPPKHTMTRNENRVNRPAAMHQRSMISINRCSRVGQVN